LVEPKLLPVRVIAKQIINRISLFIFFCCVTIISIAQEKDVDIDINLKKEPDWYQQPWVWVVGAAVFILLLVAILKGGGSRSSAK
jgi:hypothetical protein